MPYPVKTMGILTSLALLTVIFSFTDPPEADLLKQRRAATIEAKIDSLIVLMSLREKMGQTAQRGKSSRVKELPSALKAAVRRGEVE